MSRIWALLALLMRGHDLPEALPEDYRARWDARLDDPLTPTLHDRTRTFEVERRASIEEQNRRASEQAMEQVAAHWHHA